MQSITTTDPTGATISKDMTKGGVFDQLHAADELKSLRDLLKGPANNQQRPAS